MQEIIPAAEALIEKNSGDLHWLVVVAYSTEEHHSDLCADLDRLQSELRLAEDAYNRAASEKSPDAWDLGQLLAWAEEDVRRKKNACSVADDIARDAHETWQKASDQVSAAETLVKIINKDPDLIEVLVNGDLMAVDSTVLDRLAKFCLVDIRNVYPTHPALTKLGRDVVETYNLLKPQGQGQGHERHPVERHPLADGIDPAGEPKIP